MNVSVVRDYHTVVISLDNNNYNYHFGSSDEAHFFALSFINKLKLAEKPEQFAAAFVAKNLPSNIN